MRGVNEQRALICYLLIVGCVTEHVVIFIGQIDVTTHRYVVSRCASKRWVCVSVRYLSVSRTRSDPEVVQLPQHIIPRRRRMVDRLIHADGHDMRLQGVRSVVGR